MVNRISIIVVLFITIACNNDSNNSITSNSTEKLFTLLDQDYTGIDFSNDLVEDPLDDEKNILSFHHFFNGAGVATADFNNDGLQDLFFTANEGQNKLYINKGDLKFEDITATANVNEGKTWSTGVTVVDINGDGYQDLYVCQAGRESNVGKNMENLLFVNNGDLTFTESAKEYGLNDSNLGSQASFFDYDMDGDLDCFILNESKYVLTVHKEIYDDLAKPGNLEKASSKLYRNDGGKFTDVTKEAGMLKWGFGLGLVVSDINQDGWPDVYVANDYSVPDYLYINQKDGTFSEEIKSYTNQISFYSMGADIADINNDGHLDIAVVDMAADDHIRDKTLMAGMSTDLFWYYINYRKFQYAFMFNALQLNNGNNTFSNIANMAGVARTDWSWASLLADFDNDGYKDYFVSNGYRRYSRDNDFRIAMEKSKKENNGSVPMDQREMFYDMMPTIKLKNRLYRNDGHLHFVPMEDEWGMDHESFSNGAVYTDLDNDGDLDVVVNNVAMPAFVYRNNATKVSQNNFVDFKLNRKGIIHNTIVKIHTKSGIQIQEYTPTRGYLSAMDNLLHFGLGQDSKIEKVEIFWPSGEYQVVDKVEINKVVEIVYNPKGNKPLVKAENKFFEEVSPSSINVDFKHTENEFNDFALQVLLPQKQSNLGPALSAGDINRDGLTDFYIGGAVGQAGKMYVQKPDGTFSDQINQNAFAMDAAAEDVASLMYDADGDGDDDLYVVSGGYEYEAGSPTYEDRLYINMDGTFQKVKQGLPGVSSAGSCVKAGDYDGDGDLDLFVGGKVMPGKYPFSSPSMLLEFDKFRYTNVIEKLGVTGDLGIVTDASWTDVDGNGTLDLVVVGEWMSPRIFSNTGGTFSELTSQSGLQDYKGWWFSVEHADIDGDGDQDLICGNLGLNSKFKASTKKPFKVYASDFDNNGTCDVILSKDYNGKEVPTRGRQCSSEQMPFIKEKFGTYKEFAYASVIDIIGSDGAKKALNLTVTDFASYVFLNDGNGNFSSSKLPIEVQKAPILDMVIEDINKDGHLDIVTVGNIFEAEVETPRYDAGTGQVLLGDGKGGFEVQSPNQSGLFAFKNAKNMKVINRQKDQLYIVANNNDQIQVFKRKT